MDQSPVPEVKRINAEELMDSSSFKEHPEENCLRVSELEMPKCAEDIANNSACSNLASEKITFEVDTDKTPVDKDISTSEEAITSTPVGVGCVELSMPEGSTKISSVCSKTVEESITEASHESSGATEAKSVPIDVQPSTENIVPKSGNTSEFKDSIDDKFLQDPNPNTSNTEVLSKEIDNETSSQAMDVTDSSKKMDEKKEGDTSASKDVYREAIEISDSESEDSESSSVSSLSSPSKSDCESDSDIECVSVVTKTKKGTYPVIKAKGELLPEDLPPIEELHISVPSSLCAEIGVVTSIVKTLVVIQSLKGVPALDLDSVLFLDSGSRALGLVFDVFGPVNEPLYCVRFNTEEQIAEYRVNPGDKVYYAPKTEHSKYVFLQQLMRMKGSDASNQFDLEPQVQVEYSDDEEERNALTHFGDEIQAEEEGLDLDQLKRKRDPNEVVEKKKKFALQFPPRNPRGGSGRGQFPPRGRPQHRQGPQHLQHRQGQQYNLPPRHQGPIHPPSFNVPPPPIPGSSAQCQNAPPNPAANNSQGMFPNPFYQNPMQQQSASFGQLPFVQPQMDPRIAQFGAQFAQMVCNLQSSTPGGPIGTGTLPTAAPSFTTPYTQSLYPDSQSSFNAFYKPPTQGPQSAYSAPPFSAPPPLPQSNLPSINVPPPGHPQFPQPNQNATFGGQFSSSYSSYPNYR